MSSEGLLWGAGIFVVALVIIVLNDALQGKRPVWKGKLSRTLAFIYGVTFLIVTMGLCIALKTVVPFEILKWVFIVGAIGVVVFVLVYMGRGRLPILVTLIRSRRFPTIVRQNDKGQPEIKCPHCATRVPITESETGEKVFDCPNCGTKGQWGLQ